MTRASTVAFRALTAGRQGVSSCVLGDGGITTAANTEYSGEDRKHRTQKRMAKTHSSRARRSSSPGCPRGPAPLRRLRSRLSLTNWKATAHRQPRIWIAPTKYSQRPASGRLPIPASTRESKSGTVKKRRPTHVRFTKKTHSSDPPLFGIQESNPSTSRYTSTASRVSPADKEETHQQTCFLFDGARANKKKMAT